MTYAEGSRRLNTVIIQQEPCQPRSGGNTEHAATPRLVETVLSTEKTRHFLPCKEAVRACVRACISTWPGICLDRPWQQPCCQHRPCGRRHAIASRRYHHSRALYFGTRSGRRQIDRVAIHKREGGWIPANSPVPEGSGDRSLARAPPCVARQMIARRRNKPKACQPLCPEASSNHRAGLNQIVEPNPASCESSVRWTDPHWIHISGSMVL